MLLADRRGENAAGLIDQIERAVEEYPYAREYRTWPGPNSNTFTAHVARRVPDLKLQLPPTAIGKDYLAGGAWFAKPPSGRGLQISVLGLGGITVSPHEGLEVNLLGFAAGLGTRPFAVKLPGLGTWPRPRGHGSPLGAVSR